MTGKTLLLVDDEALIAMAEKRLLEMKGYTVIMAHSAPSAVDVALSNDEINLILMDIDLGNGQYGTDAAVEILAQKDIPILFLSSHTEEEVVSKTEQISSYGYVSKNTGIIVLDASIKMAFKLFDEKTKRNKIEAELTRQNSLFQILMDNLQVGVFMVEAPSGIPLLANKRAMELLGRGILPDANSKNLAEVYKALKVSTGENYPPDEMPILLGMSGEKSHIDDMLVQRPDGSTAFLEVFGTPITDGNTLPRASLVSFSDISERKKYEKEIQDKTALISKIMETSPVGIVTLNAEGVITYANRRAEQILLLSKDTITSRYYNTPSWEISSLDGSPFPEEELPFNQVKSIGKSVFGIRHAITTPDGTRVALSIHASPLLNSEGVFEGMVSTLEDITSVLASEQKMEKELKEKELLLKEIHHRVKNNIAAISKLLSMQASNANSHELRIVLNEAIGRVESMRQIYDKLLLNDEYSQIPVKKYIEELCESILEMFSHQSVVILEKEIDDFVCDIKTVFPLGSIINELMTNSLKYAFAEGERGSIKIQLSLENSQVVLGYRDNGRGLPDSFNETSSGGFGLMLIQMLAAQLNGSISMSGNDGFSATLRFHIADS